MTEKLEKKKLEKQKIDQFLNETQKKPNINNVEKNISQTEQNRYVNNSRQYICPRCHRKIKSRKEPCEFCNYKGYIQMSQEETKRIRTILFVVLMLAAIVVIVLTQ